MALVLKINEETKAPVITEDGKIVYYDDEDKDQKDLPLDPPAMYAKISDLGKQNKKDRDKYVAIRDRFSLFTDIEDLSEWKEKADAALVTVDNFNDKDWMKADKVDKLKQDMKESYEKQLLAKDSVLNDTLSKHQQELETKAGQIRKLMVSSRFASSPHFVGEKKKTTIPPDMGESYFGNAFKVEEVGDSKKLVLRAYQGDDVITSKINPGEPADFEEAISILIDNYPYKDDILSAPGGGSGGQGGKGQSGGDTTLADLKKQHQEALKNGQHQRAIGLKNQIFELEHNA